MKRLFENFKELSAKQIRTYAAIAMMSILSYEAMASSLTEGVNSETGMSPMAELYLEEEMILENWMLTPFDVIRGMETAPEAELNAALELEMAEEMVLENWMTVPFETIPAERICMGTSTCCPAP